MAGAPMYTTGGKVCKIIIREADGSIYEFDIGGDFDDMDECQNLLEHLWETGQNYCIEFIAES